MSRSSQSQLVPKGFGKVINVDTQARKMILSNTFVAATSGAGTLAAALLMDPSSAVNWAEVSNYYDEFRVIGCKVKIVSLQQFSVTSLNAMVGIAFDNDDSTAPAGINTITPYADKYYFPAVWSHVSNGGKNCELTLDFLFNRPQTASSPIPWVDVATPANSAGSIKYASGIAALTVSTNYFNIAIEWFCEVRGRR